MKKKPSKEEYISKIEEPFSYWPDYPTGLKSKIRVLKCVLYRATVYKNGIYTYSKKFCHFYIVFMII